MKLRLQKWLSWITALWVIGGTLGLITLSAIGERTPFTAALLFLPASLWMIPALLLGLAAIFIRPKLLIPLALQACWFFGIHLSPQWNPRFDRSPEPALTLVSFNRGGTLEQGLEDFVTAEGVDIILLQEANHLMHKYMRLFPDYSGELVDEFLILSKHPIVEKELIYLQTERRGLPCAGRFVVRWQDTDVVIYNVHMPTPRFALSHWWDPAVRKITYLPDPATYWKERFSLLDQLMERVAAEEGPVILGGDFNMVPRGALYRKVARQFQDFHRVGGGGHAYSYPGNALDPMGRLGPWLRLDYLFASAHWDIVHFQTEAPRKTEHLAVLGRARFFPQKPLNED